MCQKCTRFRSTLVEVIEVRNKYAPDLNDRCRLRISRIMEQRSIHLHFQQTQQQNNLFH